MNIGLTARLMPFATLSAASWWALLPHWTIPPAGCANSRHKMPLILLRMFLSHVWAAWRAFQTLQNDPNNHVNTCLHELKECSITPPSTFVLDPPTDNCREERPDNARKWWNPRRDASINSPPLRCVRWNRENVYFDFQLPTSFITIRYLQISNRPTLFEM